MDEWCAPLPPRSDRSVGGFSGEQKEDVWEFSEDTVFEHDEPTQPQMPQGVLAPEDDLAEKIKKGLVTSTLVDARGLKLQVIKPGTMPLEEFIPYSTTTLKKLCTPCFRYDKEGDKTGFEKTWYREQKAQSKATPKKENKKQEREAVASEHPEESRPPKRVKETDAQREETTDPETAAFETMAREFDKTHFRVGADYVDEEWDPDGTTIVNLKGMKERYIDKLFYWTEEVKIKTGRKATEFRMEKKYKEDNFIYRWLYKHGEDKGKRVYRKFDVVPHTLECPAYVYNTWILWPCLTQVYAKRERFVYVLSRVLKHLKILVGNSVETLEFNLKFYAQAVQYPHLKGGVLIIYVGDEGTGKSTWMKLQRNMYGLAFYSTSKPEQEIWGNFNKQAEGKFMLELAETDRSNMHDFWGRVNEFVSEEWVTVRKMQTDSYQAKNYSRIIGATNNPVPVKAGRRYAVCETSSELKFHSAVKRKSSAEEEDVSEPAGGKYRSACNCARCVELKKYHTEMNTDIMVAPETGHIFAEFLKAYKLPKNYVITENDIPQTEALMRVQDASTTQPERFLRYLASHDYRLIKEVDRFGHLCNRIERDPSKWPPTSEYTAEEMWEHFKGWSEAKEPHNIHVKSEDDLRQKIGHLRNKINASAPDALEKKEVGKKPKKRTWVLHHEKILDYFDTDAPEADEQENVEKDDFPDLDKMASDFVDTYMSAMQEEDE